MQRILWVDDGAERLRLSTLPDRIAEAALGPAEGDDDAVFERGFRLPTERARAEQFIADAIEQGRLHPISYNTGLPLARHERWQHADDAAASVVEIVDLLSEAFLQVRYRGRPESAVERAAEDAPTPTVTEGKPMEPLQTVGSAAAHHAQRGGRPRVRWRRVLEAHLPEWDSKAGKPIGGREAIRLLVGLGHPDIKREDHGDGLAWKTGNDDWTKSSLKAVQNALNEIRQQRQAAA